VSNLRWGTPTENMADRKRNSGWDLGPRHNGAKTHCKHGHEYTDENTYVQRRGLYVHRACRVCRTDQKRRHNERLKAARAASRS